MKDNTPIGYGPDKHDQHRRSIRIWFRGQVMTIGNAEEILIREEIDRQIDEQGISRESQIEPFKFSPAFHYEFKMLADRTWQYDYLRSINWDPWQIDKRVECKPASVECETCLFFNRSNFDTRGCGIYGGSFPPNCPLSSNKKVS